MARARPDGAAVWGAGPPHLVGLLVGHHGAGHVLHHVRHRHRHVRVLRTHQTGEYFNVKLNGQSDEILQNACNIIILKVHRSIMCSRLVVLVEKRSVCRFSNIY